MYLVYSLCIHLSIVAIYYKNGILYALCFAFEMRREMSPSMSFKQVRRFLYIASIDLVHSLCIHISGVIVYYKNAKVYALCSLKYYAFLSREGAKHHWLYHVTAKVLNQNA